MLPDPFHRVGAVATLLSGGSTRRIVLGGRRRCIVPNVDHPRSTVALLEFVSPDEEHGHRMMYETSSLPTSKGPLLSVEDYLSVIRARKWLVLGLTLLGLLAGLLFTSSRTEEYEAVTTVLVNPTPVASASNNLVAANLDREVEVLVGDTIRTLATERVAADGQAPLTGAEIDDGLEVEFAVGSDVIRIGFTSPEAVRAANVANAFADAYVGDRLAGQTTYYEHQLAALNADIAEREQLLTDLTGQIAALDAQRAEITRTLANNPTERSVQLDAIASTRQQAATRQNDATAEVRDLTKQQLTVTNSAQSQAPAGEILSRAETPGSPTGIGNLPVILAALVLGLILGVSAASLAERLDSSAGDPQEVTAALDSPVLGTIPTHLGVRAGRGPEHMVMRSKQSSARSHEAREAFRRLRTAIEYLMRVDELKSLLITSTNPGEGKSLTSSNLAVALASRGVRVALIDADMRRPTLEIWFGRQNTSVGLSGYLGGLGDDFEAMLFDDIPGFALVPAGPSPANPGDLLASARFIELLKELGSQVDLILIDTPPIGAAADASAAASAVDGVLLMVDAKRTSTDELRATRADLERAGANIVGAVLNRYHAGGRSGGQAYYYNNSGK